MKTPSILIAFLTLHLFATSQIDVNPPSENLDIETIIRSIDGEGIIVQNISSNKKIGTNQLAKFDDPRLFTGMKSGMLLSTGSVIDISGENKYTGMTGPPAGAPWWRAPSPAPR